MILLFVTRASSTDLSQLMSSFSINNVSLSVSYSGPFLRSPLMASTPKSGVFQISLFRSVFSRMAVPIIQGVSVSMTVSDSKFVHSSTPIRFDAVSQASKSAGNRKQYKSKSVKLIRNNFEFCHSLLDNGGALFISNCNVTISGCLFFQGSAVNGGAMYVIGSNIDIQSTNIVKCNSKKNAAGFLVKNCDIVMMNCIFCNNRAAQDVGALSVKSCSIHMKNLKFYGNHAAHRFGAIQMVGSEGQFTLCYFKDNTCPDYPFGTSFATSECPEYLLLEHCYFYDTESVPISVSTDCSIYVTNPIFMGNLDESIHIYDSEKGIKPKYTMVNPIGYGKGMPALPHLPAELLRDVILWRETEPYFEWKGLYLIIALMIIVFSMIGLIVPALILPSSKRGSRQL